MTDPRKLVEELRRAFSEHTNEYAIDGTFYDECLECDREWPCLHRQVIDALTAALDREADGEAGWTAAELGEPLDDAKPVQWLDGWEQWQALERAERAETDTARLDWLEALASSGLYVDVHGGCKSTERVGWCVLGFDDSDRVDGEGLPLAEPCAEYLPTLRAAIDAARGKP